MKARACGGPDSGDCLQRDVLAGLERALQLDPNCSAVHRELALYWDGIRDNPEKAEAHFRRAAELSGQPIA
jgi:Tfp pilus assembly protein PilF